MILLVTGSRDGHPQVEEWLSHTHAQTSITLLIVGCADGVDKQARDWADANGVDKKVFYADWEKYGRRAGPLRNGQMVAHYVRIAQLAVPVWAAAFPRSGSVGTYDCCRQLRAAGYQIEEVVL